MSCRSIGKPVPVIGARAERTPICRRESRPQPDRVALQLLDDRQQIVRERRRLRGLRVRQRREQRVAVASGKRDQSSPQLQRRVQHRQDELPLPQPVHRHVDVVAAARRVEAPGRLFAALPLDQSLDVEEQIFTCVVIGRRPYVVHRDRIERIAQRVRFVRRDDARLREHDQMRVVDRQQRRQEQRFGVFEVLAEDVVDVLGVERHAGGCSHRALAAAALQRAPGFASSLHARAPARRRIRPRACISWSRRATSRVTVSPGLY